MRKSLNRTMSAALLTGGIMVATAGFAQAIPLPLDVDEEVRVGNLVSVPVKVCGNAINVLGNSDATCDSSPQTAAADQRTMADNALVSAPVTVCGNSVGIAGGGTGSCGETKPEPPNGTIEAPVTVCGTSAAVLGTASGDCGKTEVPEEPQPEEPQPEEPQPEQPQPEQPGGGQPGSQVPGGGNNGDNNNSGGGNNDDAGAGAPQTGNKASQQASQIPNLSKTGADPLEFLLVGLSLMTAGVMARRGARRVTKA